MRSCPAATRRRRPEGTAVSRFEDVLWAVRAARSSRTAVPCPPAAAKYRQLLMHAVCASAGSSSHCMIAPHQRLQVRSRWLFRPGQRSSGCGVLQKQGRRRVFGHTQAPVSPARSRAATCMRGPAGWKFGSARPDIHAPSGAPPPATAVQRWARPFVGWGCRLQRRGPSSSRRRRTRPGSGDAAAKPRGGRREEACRSPADLRPSGA